MLSLCVFIPESLTFLLGISFLPLRTFFKHRSAWIKFPLSSLSQLYSWRFLLNSKLVVTCSFHNLDKYFIGVCVCVCGVCFLYLAYCFLPLFLWSFESNYCYFLEGICFCWEFVVFGGNLFFLPWAFSNVLKYRLWNFCPPLKTYMDF